MSKDKGVSVLVKIGDGQDPEVFEVVCGLISKTITFNNNSYDVTTPSKVNPEGQVWQEIQTGIRSLEVSGNGLSEGGTTLDRLRAVFFGAGEADTADAVANFELVIPALGQFAGAFHIDSFEVKGEQEGGVEISLSMKSTGYIAYTAI